MRLSKPGRIMWVVCGLAVLALVAFAGHAWYQNASTWNGLRAQARQFEPPSEWTAVGTAQEGSKVCVISCDEPRVTVVFRTTASPLDACDQIRAAVASQTGASQGDSDFGYPCGYGVPRPGGGWITAGARRANAFTFDNSPSWTTKIPPTGSGTLAWIQFASHRP